MNYELDDLTHNSYFIIQNYFHHRFDAAPKGSLSQSDERKSLKHEKDRKNENTCLSSVPLSLVLLLFNHY